MAEQKLTEVERLQIEVAIAVALVQRLTDARQAGVSLVDASVGLEDWAVNVADSIPDEVLEAYENYG
jgi:hypothetical protein